MTLEDRGRCLEMAAGGPCGRFELSNDWEVARAIVASRRRPTTSHLAGSARTQPTSIPQSPSFAAPLPPAPNPAASVRRTQNACLLIHLDQGVLPDVATEPAYPTLRARVAHRRRPLPRRCKGPEEVHHAGRLQSELVRLGRYPLLLPGRAPRRSHRPQRRLLPIKDRDLGRVRAATDDNASSANFRVPRLFKFRVPSAHFDLYNLLTLDDESTRAEGPPR